MKSLSNLAGNATQVFPYKVVYHATSEIVTRYDLANTTVPSTTSVVGETKTMFYDAGETMDIGGQTWLRCDGQAIDNAISPALFSAAKSSMSSQGQLTLPTSSQNNYIYICIR